ncbi:alcohol dehydrogenase [Fusarium napiforme]|uniref:Alcohol dehydrogenase n=1 Tax=Fusarium napiforme TaxID=42672 RepID=A0A8H5N7Y7_9HYPO|nr:alcohol dehydrogenase [Fusarium napiforme]
MENLPNNMRAVVFGKANEPLTLTEKPLPVPECGELLVKIKAVSICASDFVPWKGYLGPVDGLVPGHEGVGIVVGNELPLEKLAPLFCAGVTAFRAVKQVDAPARGKIGVFGLGGVGLFAVRFAVAVGFDVVGFDVSPVARQEAKKAGALDTFDSSELAKCTEAIQKLTGGRLLEGAIVAAGVPQAYDAAIKLTAVFKTVVAVGVPHDAIQVDPLSLIRKGLNLKGSLTGAASDLEEMMRLVQRHQIIPDVQLGGLEDIPEMFARCCAGTSVGKLGAVIS